MVSRIGIDTPPVCTIYSQSYVPSLATYVTTGVVWTTRTRPPSPEIATTFRVRPTKNMRRAWATEDSDKSAVVARTAEMHGTVCTNKTRGKETRVPDAAHLPSSW